MIISNSNNAPYEFSHAIHYLRMAIDFAESTGDLTKARQWANEVEKAHDAEMKERSTTEITLTTSATTNP